MALQFYAGDVLILGLTLSNLKKLVDGNPLFLELRRPIMQLCTVFGQDKASILDQMKTHGFDVPESVDRGVREEADEVSEATAMVFHHPDEDQSISLIRQDGQQLPIGTQGAARATMDEIFQYGRPVMVVHELVREGPDGETSQQLATQVFLRPSDPRNIDVLENLKTAVVAFEQALTPHLREPS